MQEEYTDLPQRRSEGKQNKPARGSRVETLPDSPVYRVLAPAVQGSKSATASAKLRGLRLPTDSAPCVIAVTSMRRMRFSVKTSRIMNAKRYAPNDFMTQDAITNR
jgi:hypothetical protein